MLVLFNITYSVLLFSTYSSSFIGFGLGDGFGPSVIWGYFEALREQSPFLFYGSLLLVVFYSVFKLQIMIRGQLAYKINYPSLPVKKLLLYALANGLNIAFIVHEFFHYWIHRL